MKNTKQLLLEATFKEIYKHGYQATSLSKIMYSSKLTKGALYHYFKSKKEISLETIEIILGKFINEYWEEPIKNTDTPLETLHQQINNFPSAKIFEHTFLNVKHGCFLNNLIQEMAPLDDDFSILLQNLYSRFENSILLALKKAKIKGQINSEINITNAAIFITASIEACITTAKLKNEINYYNLCTGELQVYLNSIKSDDNNEL